MVRRLLVLALVAATALGAEDILIADFEATDYGAWKVEGEAFGPGPARGTLPNQMHVDGFLGKGLVNSYFKGDGTTGTLTSPPFKIERKFINFLLGGGGYKDETYIALLVDGKAVRTATGPNVQPGGSERLAWHSWDVADLSGKEAMIQIVDKRTGGWGHINVDHIIQSDRKREEKPAMRELVIERRYLHLPVKNGASKQRMKVSIGPPGGDAPPTIVDEFDIELADGRPDFWVFLDLALYKGQKARIDTARLPEESEALAAITQSDEVPDAAGLYRERHRPQFHFSSRRGWNNDPNGLVFHKGEYHLYYQHNPYGWNWGNMHWGHAVSRDLVHWTELPIALYPQRYGDWVFSGSAVVDRENTGGWKTGAEDVLVAAYTSTGRGECIAFSNDRGRTFTDYERNPVVKHAGRDPKLVWYAPGKHWVMAVYDEHAGKQWIAFHSSPNLKDWTLQSRIEGYFECPEIFELPVDGDKARTRWVVYAADGAYAVGSFDGKSFTPDHPGKHRFNWGNCFYASQTFSNIPPEDGRRIQIAWGRIGHKDMPFNQMMNFPVQLTLRTTDEGVRMFAEPVKEIELLHAKKHSWAGLALKEGENPLKGIEGDLFHIIAEIEPGDAAQVGVAIRGTPVVYDARGQQLNTKGCNAPLKPEGDRIRLEILVDRTSIEVFANRGRVYMPVGVIPPDEARSLEVFARGGTARLASLEVHELRSAWER
ncbi:MAG TPA: glycoside hydrolase family 32 protein [Planctomycetota bacterium]|nr:glycoside hydrolase family 32 protein [Planctomycetota bacterium]HRR79389.1 glycoside hydrolase family 32 protein [Planctomycetota bacterium]HRT96612.1 glycoside hydrolase family 32 protein [Planctomycetota bacterium]